MHPLSSIWANIPRGVSSSVITFIGQARMHAPHTTQRSSATTGRDVNAWRISLVTGAAHHDGSAIPTPAARTLGGA